MFKRNIVTRGIEKNFFFIRNLKQALYFLQNNIELQDLRLEYSRLSKTKRLTFVFMRNKESNEVFDHWCNGQRDLKTVYNENNCFEIKNITKNLYLCQQGNIPVAFLVDENNNIWFQYEKGETIKNDLNNFKIDNMG